MRQIADRQKITDFFLKFLRMILLPNIAVSII